MYEFLRLCGYGVRLSESYESDFALNYDSRAYWEKDDTDIDYRDISPCDIITFINKELEMVDIIEEAIEYLFFKYGMVIEYDATFDQYKFAC